MTDYTRLTIVGSARRATIVVPSDESIGALVPRLMELLEERVASVARPLTLVRLTGEQLDATMSTAEQGVGDGEVLRLLRLDEAPPPPEVSDVTDTVSETLATRPGLWSAGHRTVLGAGAIGVLALVAGSGTDTAPVAAVAGWAVAAVAAASLGLAGRVSASRVLLGAALGLSLPAAVWLATGLRFGFEAGVEVVETKEQFVLDAVAFPMAALLVFAWLALLLGVGVGRRSRPAALGSAAGAVSGIVASAMLTAGLPLGEAAAILTLLAAVACGLVPWYAMSASGLTGLDDQVMAGRLAERTSVLQTVGDAYRTLTWTTFAVATALAAGLTGLVWSQDPWLNALAAVAILVSALRTRAFPLAAQAWALWVAALVPIVGYVVWHPGSTWLLGAVALVVALLVIARPAIHQRASLRRLGNVVESLAVIALVPLALGAFGVFGQLLGAF
ncbi:type VII secretion integral membrane protein EccD [Frondihabitans sp. PhB188]|uniref:EsaB/YukD family protein n=1 Tax=Frondihabitans sp. PhB188 TaxID=2485200 RepID=UPI000F4693A4|nr:EsaB/YukD family protein [Frondihabitans sp. PhB188]ROQ40753.1 type VII secretion integral membrane protein EccD [Frondihabitans sp. PhB188]